MLTNLFIFCSISPYIQDQLIAMVDRVIATLKITENQLGDISKFYKRMKRSQVINREVHLIQNDSKRSP